MKSEPEYLDNWVEQYDLLCEPKWRIGLIGSFFWIGVLVTMIPVTWIADKYGRKLVVMISYVIFMIAVIGIMLASDINMLYFLLFVCGATLAGRVVVSINYVIEFITEKNKGAVMFIKMFASSVLICIFTAIF